jgi:Bacterial regulatory protein, Fis family
MLVINYFGRPSCDILMPFNHEGLFRYCSRDALMGQGVGGDQLRAAQLLGITRRTLRLRLRELGLSVTKTVEAAESDDVD